MRRMPSRTTIAATVAAAFVALSAAAFAQNATQDKPATTTKPAASAPRMNPDQRAERRGARMAEMIQRHADMQAQLKKDLKITAEQETAWKQFTDATAPKPPAEPPMMARQDWAQLTTPERLEKMQAMRADRQKVMDQHVAAVKAFYAVLSPEQQKVFDAHGPGFGPDGQMGPRGQHRGDRQHQGPGKGRMMPPGGPNDMGCDGPGPRGG